jgi:dihydroneopterin aldolase
VNQDAGSSVPGGLCIELRGLRIVGTHGVLAEERARPQPFVVDLDVWLDAESAIGSDQLVDTADYAALVERATEVMTTRSFQLLEAAAGAIADQLIAADPAVLAVGVSVTKVRPPVAADLGSVGVRLIRQRAQRSSDAT